MNLTNFTNKCLIPAIALTSIASSFFAFTSPTLANTVFRNAQWRINIGNEDSWNGVNGTGNLTYRGCDTRNRCVSLTNGKISCRDGVCTRAWRNGEYTYVVSSPITENGSASSTLIVRRGDRVIVRSTGLR
ncbi:hypothetical protein [Argonema antarcticum]|uniref:hypothetical protein n=1 Tax=Argonema antarcticum TaxID=2942763 RepID=UPI0020123518|nr:hypothetical protein [Argonema antarcticum]MCL1475269.1 hypothetical protein [Argonema antarcticum A004/B2]